MQFPDGGWSGMLDLVLDIHYSVSAYKILGWGGY